MEEEHHDLGAVPAGNQAGEEVEGEHMELGQAVGVGVGTEETPANSNACCICYEPWTFCGAHRICCIPCGHVYGRSCLEKWLIRSGCIKAKCLWCERQFKREDIVNLYGTTEQIWKHHDRAARHGAAEETEAAWQVFKVAMEVLVAETTRERTEIAREREEIAHERRNIAWQRVELAQKDVEITRRNLEMARRIEEEEISEVDRFPKAPKAVFIFILLVLVILLVLIGFLLYKLFYVL